MSSFNFEIKGLDAVVTKIKKLPKEVEDKVQGRLEEFAFDTVGDAKMLCPVDEGHLIRSITPEIKHLQVAVKVAADYASYVEFGTRKYAAQYVASLPADWQAFARQFKGKGGGTFQEMILRITGWVKRKGIAKGKNIDRVAYLIALKILRTGIRARPFLIPAAESNRIKLETNLRNDFK